MNIFVTVFEIELDYVCVCGGGEGGGGRRGACHIYEHCVIEVMGEIYADFM